MGFGLKLFWGLILAVIVTVVIYLAFFNIPSPAVNVKKNIDLTTRFQ